MKREFSKILGATLALVLVFALGVALAPAPQVAASPAANKWAKFSIPSAGSLGDYILVPVDATANTSTWVAGPGPLEMSKDGDLWCYWDVSSSASSNIYRSTDEGRSWSKKGSSTSVVADKDIVDFACSPEDNDVVFAASTVNEVYKTSDGGSTWAKMAAIGLSDNENITSLDVSYKDGRHYIAVGTANDVTPNGEVYVKPDIAYETWEAQDMTAGNQVWDVAFSPNFATETNENVVAVTTDINSGGFVRHQFSGGDWDTTKAQLWSGLTLPSDTVGADIAFPDDYDSTTSGGRELFVSIDGSAATHAQGYQLGTKGDGTAVYTDADYYGSSGYSVLLSDGGQAWTPDENYGAGVVIVTGVNTLLASITSLSFWFNYDNPDDAYNDFIPALSLHIDTTGNGVEDYVACVESPPAANAGYAEKTWVKWDLTDANVDFHDYDGWNKTLAEVKTFAQAKAVANGLTDAVVLSVIVGEGAWRAPTSGDTFDANIAYIDDIEINGKVYDLEPDDPTTFGGVYYVIANKAYNKKSGIDFSSLDLRGPAGDACILACDADTKDVYRSSDGGGTWNKSSQDPSGPGTEGAYVVVADDFVDSGKAWVATVGAAKGDQCAISFADRNDNGKCWIQISMINTEIESLKAKGLAFSPDFATDNTMFMITTAKTGGAPDDSLWKWDGSYWSRVQDNDTLGADIDSVQVSPDFATSNTVYLADQGAKRLYYSKDGGERFIKQSSGPDAFNDANAWVVLDYNTVLVGGSNTVYKATRRDGARYSSKTASFGGIKSFARSPDYDNDSTVICGGSTGKIGLSTNGGDTWKQKPAGVKVKSDATTCYVAFDSDFADNSIIYAAAEGSKAVFRLEVDVSTSWSKISSGTDTSVPTTPLTFSAAPSGIVAANGAAYCAVATGLTDKKVAKDILVSRSINPATGSTTSSKGVYFEAVTKSFSGTVANTANGIWLTEGASNVVWVEETGAGTNAIWKYEDALIVAPTLKSPDDGASTGRTGTATLKWEEMEGASSYYIVVSGNEDFSPLFDDWDWVKQTSSTTSYSVSDLSPGSTYYWKMRSKGYAVSPWSEVRSFTTGIGAAEWNPFTTPSGVGPSAGATDVPLRPAFQWNAADWATGYDFVLADNAAFASPIVSESVTTTTFALDTDLAYSTSYYWKVRAVSATTSSNWGTGIFTTMAKAAEAPAPVEITPAPPAPVLPTPETPVYVWTIIGIGALLVIALIVLIVRTRRVA